MPDEEVHQRLDEGLFEVLCGVGLSLSPLTRLLPSPSGKSHEDTQLQLMQLEVGSTLKHSQSPPKYFKPYGLVFITMFYLIPNLMRVQCRVQSVERDY